ncbi:MAG: DNA mismatch repair endonuclease MutL [Bacteroidales bacterium]|nr:DNA mismatch repair endonuclease MutL [Bacteroidales bacterium]
MMTDIIHLLPDSVANQIAAGEVVQRPASALKELLENTIDAGANDVIIIIREAGKSLIQVIDNGCGMSERDARMCFERHATSKIQKADDLLAIRTLGFRGEALASIASVAQVELKSKRHEDEIGTKIIVEGTEFKGQSPVSCQNGTSISVKNLFFNVPARRNFLKSNNVELKNIIEEFFRVALVNPAISFTLYNQERILFQTHAGNLKQRIINLYGPSYAQKLIPVEQQTELVNFSGYIGKPEFAKKSKGEQYFFTNGRFMRSPYLHHAIENAFQELITKDSFPSYFIFLEVDPKTIDVNIHPSKTEINFQDIRSIYTILNAAIKQSIGKFSLSPTIDFEVEQSMNITELPAGTTIKQPTITINPDYNPFEKTVKPQNQFSFPASRSSVQAMNDFYKDQSTIPHVDLPSTNTRLLDPEQAVEPPKYFQIKNSFLVTHSKRGVIIIDQQHAHERILYEQLIDRSVSRETSRQQLVIPVTIHLTPDDLHLLQAWKDHFSFLGFDISGFGKDSVLVTAIPPDIEPDDIEGLIESILESLKSTTQDNKSSRLQLLARSLAKKISVKRGKKLQPEEISSIIENLFACKVPEISPDGKLTMVILSFEELLQKFKH